MTRFSQRPKTRTHPHSHTSARTLGGLGGVAIWIEKKDATGRVVHTLWTNFKSYEKHFHFRIICQSKVMWSLERISGDPCVRKIQTVTAKRMAKNLEIQIAGGEKAMNHQMVFSTIQVRLLQMVFQASGLLSLNCDIYTRSERRSLRRRNEQSRKMITCTPSIVLHYWYVEIHSIWYTATNTTTVIKSWKCSLPSWRGHVTIIKFTGSGS